MGFGSNDPPEVVLSVITQRPSEQRPPSPHADPSGLRGLKQRPVAGSHAPAS
jgi:hypothetical protein